MKKEIFKKIITDLQKRDLNGVIERNINISINVGKVISIIGVRRKG